MKDISSYFEKALNLLSNDSYKKKLTAETIEKITGISVNVSDLTFTEGIVYLSTPNSIKSVVYINKEAILDAINSQSKKPSVKMVFDIR